MSDRREARLLLAVLREDWEAGRRIVGAGPVDGQRFVSLARQCDVHPCVDALLRSGHGRGILDDDALELLGRWRRKCRHDNLLLLASLEKSLDLLRDGGIVPVALKGVDLVHRGAFDFDERTLDDADLLVLPEQFARALEILETAGWKTPPEPERTHWLRSSFQIPLWSPGPLPVLLELHWGLGQTGRYAVDTAELVGRARPLEVAGRAVLRLEERDAVAHLFLHHVQHYFDRRLKWAVDLVRTRPADGFDWEGVRERLAQWGGCAAAGMVLRHLRKWFPGLVPRQATRLFPAAWWRRALTAPLLSSHPLDLYRWTRRRPVQLYLATVLLEKPSRLPRYLLHRATRDRKRGGGPPIPSA